MPRYMIIRSFEVGEDQMPSLGSRSRQLTEAEFAEITWEHSHVVVDDEGLVHTYCVYEAPNEDVVRAHVDQARQAHDRRAARDRGRRDAGRLPAGLELVSN